MSVKVNASDKWRGQFPGAQVGILAIHGVSNPTEHPSLNARAEEEQRGILAKYAGMSRADLRPIPALQPYVEYFKRFGKTYHVQLQLESVLFKGKRVAGPNVLVQGMFMAELKNLLLTAGHDLGAVRGDLTIDASTGAEQYELLGGKEQLLKPDDMFIADEAGILSSVIYGPDQRTRITRDTGRVLFAVYAPPGISKDMIETHLGDLEANVRLLSPNAIVESRLTVFAN